MWTKPKLLSAVLALALLTPSVVVAGLREVAEGVFVEDFEDGELDQWGVDEREQKQDVRVPEVLEIVKDGGRGALHIKGRFQNRVFYKERTFGDFSLHVRLKKTAGNYAGIVVRDHWRVYLQMKCFLSLNSDQKGWESKGEVFKSDRTFPGYRDLKVVCAGPLLHVFVDGEPIVKRRIPPGEGRLGFYSHGNGEAYYDELRIETRVAPEYYLLVEPEAAGDCLVFSPDENVKLHFRVSNYLDSPQRVTVAAAVKTWAGDVVKEETRRDVTVPAGGDGGVEFDVGRVAGGFYRVELQASCAGKEVCRIDDLPLAVHHRGSGAFRPPAIPVAAYYKYFNKTSPLYRNTYAHAAARNLRDHHFNAVVADPSFTEEIIDIFQSYGIATIARGKFMDRPAVIATLVGDEPKPEEIEQLKQQYKELREQTDKPVTTCLVGDALGLGREGGPLWIWRQLEPGLRCFRWYGIKKSFYGILHEVKYKPYLPLSTVLRIAEASSDTPYWLVAPSLGKSDHESYFHKPTPAETRGMMHLALAYGCDGILFWAFQSHGSWPCLVDQKSLEAVDGNYAAAAEVAAKIEAHADVIRSLEHVGLDVRCPNPVVDAVPRRSGKDDKLCVYAVNKDTNNPVSTRLLLWAEIWTLTSVRDLYSGKSFPVEKDQEGYWSVPLTFGPGEGLLLITDAAQKR